MVYDIGFYRLNGNGNDIDLDLRIYNGPEFSPSQSLMRSGITMIENSNLNFMGDNYEALLQMGRGNLRYKIVDGRNILKKISDIENTVDLFNQRIERSKLLSSLDDIVSKDSKSLLLRIDENLTKPQSTL
tara:strand:+ start:415 stop:804 length:390 start_codon:yes stop_codon:yes gene_type:complete